MIYITEASEPELVGRRAEILWTDLDDRGLFACVRMLDGAPVEYGEPDGYTVIAERWSRVPPPRPPRPDERLFRWLPRTEDTP